MKILLSFALVFALFGCGANESKLQNVANTEPIKPPIVTRPKPEPKTDSEFLAYAKNVLGNPSSEKFEVEAAYRYLRAVSKSAGEYAEAQKMLNEYEKQQAPIRKQNQVESEKIQKNKFETAQLKIGMTYWDVEAMCGEPSDTSNLESARATITTARYEFSEKRKANDCFGTLTFIDYKLDSIYRD